MRGREERVEHFICGINPVLEVLRSGKRQCHQLYVDEGRRDSIMQKIVETAKKKKVQIIFSKAAHLERLANGGHHQGVLLKADPPVALELFEALVQAPPDPKSVWLALDQVTDPHNLGAMLRNASFLGAGAVILPERRSAPITPAVERVASGGAALVRIVDVVNLNQAILKLKEKGFWIYGAALEGKPIGEVQLCGPALLVIGSEGEGLREKTRGHCDELIRIPQAPGGVESLNASCASAILLFEIRRRLAP
jgi:23S rRNA (guanosine2251-2'-O)-methyltransferase